MLEFYKLVISIFKSLKYAFKINVLGAVITVILRYTDYLLVTTYYVYVYLCMLFLPPIARLFARLF